MKQILSFWGLMGFPCHYISNFAIMARALYQVRETHMGPLAHLSIVHCHFFFLGCPSNVPALSLLDSILSYHVFRDERSEWPKRF